MRLCVSLLGAFFIMQRLWAAPGIIIDPNNVLGKTDQFFENQKFESTLTCESKARFFAPVQSADLGCNENGCWEFYQTQEFSQIGTEVHNCSSEAVSLYSDDGRILDITKNDFEKARGNMLRLFLPTLGGLFGYEGEITLLKAMPVQYTLPSGQKLEALQVEGVFRLEIARPDQGFPLLFTLIKSGPGVAQIARVRLGSQTWLRLADF